MYLEGICAYEGSKCWPGPVHKFAPNDWIPGSCIWNMKIPRNQCPGYWTLLHHPGHKATMAPGVFVCPYCKRNNFGSSRGLSQHQQLNPSCNKQMKQAVGVSKHRTGIAHDFMPTVKVKRTYGRQLIGGIAETIGRLEQVARAPVAKPSARAPDPMNLKQQSAKTSQEFTELADEADNSILFGEDDDVSGTSLSDSGTSLSDNEVPTVVNSGNSIPHLGEEFQEYMRFAEHNLIDFTKSEANAIRLLITLRNTKASLGTYEDIMRWHFTANGKMNERKTLSQVSGYISRETIFNLLRKRYNCNAKSYGNIATLSLPHSRAKVEIVWNDAKAAIISLLTDPRIQDEDYLFWGDDPLATPPIAPDFVKDLNTGTSYTQTYAKLVTKPGKQVLLPVIFYIDGANTGQFVDLPITAVKISLGIFKRKSRDRDHFWRTIGYIPAIAKEKSRGRRQMVESKHHDSVMAHPDALDDEGFEVDKSVPKAQDLHTMLAKILDSYVELQESGFLWDLHYKNNIYRDVEFVLYTPFFKVDGDEAEKLCGKYTSRNANVAQLCRYCECPTDDSDDHLALFRYKTKAKILRMTLAEDRTGLQNMSQHLIQNATYRIRFGSQTKRGIHGACPMEMLHATLLGIFKYVRDCFFEQMGPTSGLADDINALAQQYGDLLSRQSDRNLPKTRFGKGIVRGKLMAKEYPGILLCIAAVLRSTGGRKRLMQKNRAHLNCMAL